MDSSAKGNSHGVMLVAVSAVFEALAISAVALRLWSRRLKEAPLAANDYTILLALASAASTRLNDPGYIDMFPSAFALGGLGQHTAALASHPEKLVVFGKSFVIVSPLWVSSITAVKISILDLYIRIFRSRIFRICCITGMVICALFWVLDMLLAFLICQPLAFNWDRTIQGGHCGQLGPGYISVHALNFVIDVSIAILPMPILWRLQMATRKKIELTIMFSLGTLICIISVLRIVLYERLNTTDLTYDTVVLFSFTALEPLLAIILASLPVMRPAGLQLVHSSVFSWSKALFRSSKAGSSSKHLEETGSDLHPANPKRQIFHRRHDNLHPSTVIIDIESYAMDDRKILFKHPSSDGSDVAPTGINVTKAWDVVGSSASR